MKTDLKVLPGHTQGFWRFYLADRMAERLCGHSYIHIRKTHACVYIYIHTDLYLHRYACINMFFLCVGIHVYSESTVCMHYF